MAITADEINAILSEWRTRNTETYVGMRYVPKFSDDVAWSADVEYEPLTMVTYNQAIYVSKFYVPVGVQITNTDYWIIWGTFEGVIIKPEMIADNSITADKLDVSIVTTVTDGNMTFSLE